MRSNWLFLMPLLFGCAASNYYHESKSGKETEQDLFVCENKILAEHSGLSGETSKQKQELLDDCMKDKGYQVKR